MPSLLPPPRGGAAGEAGGPSWALRVLLLGAVLHLPFLGRGELRGNDELRYAQVADEMVRGRHWIVPRSNGAVYAEKPPLFFWAEALPSLAAGRVTAWTARLPAALAGIALALAVFLLGARLHGPPAGFLAALLLLLSPEVHAYATDCRLDLPFALFITVAILLAHGRGEAERPGAASGAALGAVLAAALLTKGPIGVVLPLGIVALFFLLHREAWRIPRACLSPWTWGVLLLLAGAWAGAAVRDPDGGWGYLGDLSLGKGVGSVASARRHARWRATDFLLYYPGALAGGAAPWSLFLPAACAAFWPRRAAGGGRLDRCWNLPSLWLAAGLVAFSASPAKRPPYILPIYPAAALLLAPVVREAFRKADRAPGTVPWLLLDLPAWALAAAAVAVPLAAPWVLPLEPAAAAVAGAGALAGTAAVLLLARGRGRDAFRVAAGLAIAAFLAADGGIAHGPAARDSWGPAVREIERAARGGPVAAWLCYEPWMPLGLGRPIVRIDRPGKRQEPPPERLSEPAISRAFLVIGPSDARRLGERLGDRREAGACLGPEDGLLLILSPARSASPAPRPSDSR